MATKKFPPFLGKETPAEEKKEMKVKKASPALYKKAEMAEGVHGKMMKKGGKVAKYARGGGIEAKGKTRGKVC
jgi:hypothetical protein